MAGGGNISPRQKMINMMYLVLTALLALNVSAEILKAFSMINESMDASNLSIDEKNEQLYQIFEKKLKDEPGKTKPFYDRAMEAKAICAGLIKEIKTVKEKMIDEAGNKNGKHDDGDYKEEADGPKQILRDDDIDISSRLMTEPLGRKAMGEAFRAKMESGHDKLVALINEKDRAVLKLNFARPVDPIHKKGQGKHDWLDATFGHMPVAGAVTVLTKFESDVKNSETEIVNYLLGDIESESFKFTDLMAKVIAESNYVLVGQQYKADVILVAYDKRQDLNINVGGARLKVEEGVGKYVTVASGEGVKQLSGSISVKSPSGEMLNLPFKTEYQVAKPAAVISPDKMNVFYIGVPNPVSVSAPGIALDKLKVSISAGSLTGSGGKYVVTQSQPGKVMINVAADYQGKAMQMGGMEFRVKYIPDPQPTVGGVMPGSIASSQFKAQGGVIAMLKDFDFDAKFSVQKFRLIYLAPRQDAVVKQATGPLFTNEMESIIRNSKPGDKFIIDEIKAVGPDNNPRNLPGISYSLN